MRQAFLNLLINAVESMDGKGVVNVSVDARPLRKQVCVMIEDDGPGIPGHIIPKIFIPFFTTKKHGTGLGLSLVQKIVLAHNGRVDVQCTEGKGTRFTAIFPSL